jgi:hypothetical protein
MDTVRSTRINDDPEVRSSLRPCLESGNVRVQGAGKAVGDPDAEAADRFLDSDVTTPRESARVTARRDRAGRGRWSKGKFP